jgi:hypothetical protein
VNFLRNCHNKVGSIFERNFGLQKAESILAKNKFSGLTRGKVAQNGQRSL